MNGVTARSGPARAHRRRGVTLLEMLVAVTLLSLLAGGILVALHVGLNGMAKAKARLMDNRRLAGTQRILEEQIAGFMPVMGECVVGADQAAVRIPFFQGAPQSMRFVSAYSLREAWRGLPQILEFQVIPGEPGGGVRLIVNEHPYGGPRSTGVFCAGMVPAGEGGLFVPAFQPITAGPQSFVLADRLAYCRFSFLLRGRGPAEPDRWVEQWTLPVWPAAVRMEMAPIEEDTVRLRPLNLVVPVRVTAAPGRSYGS
jgi:prepilin-type N-terminal cleavage/methylation domain-containing protein